MLCSTSLPLLYMGHTVHTQAAWLLAPMCMLTASSSVDWHWLYEQQGARIEAQACMGCWKWINSFARSTSAGRTAGNRTTRRTARGRLCHASTSSSCTASAAALPDPTSRIQVQPISLHYSWCTEAWLSDATHHEGCICTQHAHCEPANIWTPLGAASSTPGRRHKADVSAEPQRRFDGPARHKPTLRNTAN